MTIKTPSMTDQDAEYMALTAPSGEVSDEALGKIIWDMRERNIASRMDTMIIYWDEAGPDNQREYAEYGAAVRAALTPAPVVPDWSALERVIYEGIKRSGLTADQERVVLGEVTDAIAAAIREAQS